MTEIIKIETPLSDEDARSLRAGDRIYLSGVIYTGRDAAHKRLTGLLQEGRPLPIDIEGQVIYYVGPAPASAGRVIGSAGPTTSGRMDAYAPALIALGLKGMVGKGVRSDAVKDAMREYGAVYFGATGGAGALLARRIKSCRVVAYEDLGPEAIHRLEVVDFPLVVVNDSAGGDLYRDAVEIYGRM
ncbi:MAG: Fe-S-containing hydro-lyase [Armatimonadota bacterium]|jgi:fumarate hydratase subunit beta